MKVDCQYNTCACIYIEYDIYRERYEYLYLQTIYASIKHIFTNDLKNQIVSFKSISRINNRNRVDVNFLESTCAVTMLTNLI